MRSVVAAAVLLLIGCNQGPKGDTGPAGPQGPAGPSGPPGPSGASYGVDAQVWRDADGGTHGLLGSLTFIDAAGQAWFIDTETGQTRNTTYDGYADIGYWQSSDCTGERYTLPVYPRFPVRIHGADAGYWVRPDGLRSETITPRSTISGTGCTALTNQPPSRLLRLSGFVPLATPPPNLPDVGPLHMERLSAP